MFSEIINKLTKWRGKDVVIVADTINHQGKKAIVTYHGELLRVEHRPLDHNVLFSFDEIVIRTSDTQSHISFPTEYIEKIEILTTEVIITKRNGFKATITLNQK